MKVVETTKGGHQYLTRELSQRLAGSNVSVVVAMPGFIDEAASRKLWDVNAKLAGI